MDKNELNDKDLELVNGGQKAESKNNKNNNSEGNSREHRIVIDRYGDNRKK